jgi:hypothetical protein
MPSSVSQRVILPVTAVLVVSSVPAGRNDDIASRWGPRIVELLRTVAAALSRHQVGQ